MSQIYWFQYYLPISSVVKKDLSFQRQSKNTEVHREYPSSTKNQDGERSSPGTAVADKTGKYAIGSRQSTREKTTRQYTWQTFIFLEK